MTASRVARIVGFATAMALVATAPGSAPAGGTSAAYDQGLRLFEAGRFVEAIPYLSQVLERHPRDTTTLNRRGICYLRTDQAQKALADFERINDMTVRFMRGFGDRFGVDSPSYPEACGNRGIALLMLGRDQEALDSFLDAVRLWKWQGLNKTPRSVAGAYEGLGQAYHRLGQHAAAIAAYNQAKATDPTDPNAYAGRGDILADRQLYDEAIADYDDAIRVDPSHSRAFAGRGIVRYLQGRDEAALADFDRAIALDPGFAKAYSYRGAVHSRRGQNELALADYDAVIKLMPGNAGAYKDRGGVLFRLGRNDQAIRDLDEAIRLDPKRATAYQNRGAAHNALGHYEQAIDDLDEAIKLDPENAGAYSNRGLAHYAIGDYERAIVDLSQAIQIEPKTPTTHYNRAEVFVRLGMRERAIEDYQAAIALDPRLAPAYAAIGRIKSQLGQREEAMRDFDMALRLDAQGVGVGVYQDRGHARREGGDWSGAVADYDRAIALRPRQADLYVARGWARLASGAEWADNDGRAYLALKGWDDPFSPYMALLTVLGARGTSREAEARRLLHEVIVNRTGREWPIPILLYFRGDLGEAALIRSTGGIRQRAEAHVFIGLERLRAGDRDAALPHLHYAREHGTPGSIAADVATATLGRLEPGG